MSHPLSHPVCLPVSHQVCLLALFLLAPTPHLPMVTYVVWTLIAQVVDVSVKEILLIAETLIQVCTSSVYAKETVIVMEIVMTVFYASIFRIITLIALMRVTRTMYQDVVEILAVLVQTMTIVLHQCFITAAQSMIMSHVAFVSINRKSGVIATAIMTVRAIIALFLVVHAH